MRAAVNPAAGEVWDLELDPTIGHEQGGRRPAVVISSELFNLIPNGMHIIVPITSRVRGVRAHLAIDPPEGGIKNHSVIMCDQVRSLSVLRFHRRRGEVSAETLAKVRELVSWFVDR